MEKSHASNEGEKFDPEVNNSESYKHINETYLNVLNVIEDKIEKYFSNIRRDEELIS